MMKNFEILHFFKFFHCCQQHLNLYIYIYIYINYLLSIYSTYCTISSYNFANHITTTTTTTVKYGKHIFIIIRQS